MKSVLVFGLIIFLNHNSFSWGFYAHKRINRMAVFTLPPEMILFFKTHIDFIEKSAINPDQRRYLLRNEAENHFMDLDKYDSSFINSPPLFWNDALKLYPEDTLRLHGINPWHVLSVKNFLTAAFKNKDTKAILHHAADLGHYIADGHVPLHTTRNYNGQFTNQKGIHGLWESRLPELFATEYEFFVGKAEYITNPQKKAWEAILKAHVALDSVLIYEQNTTKIFSIDKKYNFEDRNGKLTKVYAKKFCEAYHQKLNGQVERQMKAAIKLIGDFWFTAWVDAGQPNLVDLIDKPRLKEMVVIQNDSLNKANTIKIHNDREE
jgi:hypothetical protein